jgi:Ligated ion channel L-glutamate- and glycine-binding site
MPLLSLFPLSQLKFEALSSFLHQMVPVFEANGFPIRRFECNEERDVTTTDPSDDAEQLLNDLSRMIESNDLIYVDDELRIWQKWSFDVRRSLNGSSAIETIATVDRDGVKMSGRSVIGRTKRFFRIGVTESLPYTYYKRDPKTNAIVYDVNQKPVYEGYCIDLISQLSRKLNFDYELVEPSTGKFGERQSNGKFDGLIGDMVRGEIDVIVSALKMTAEREEVIDFVVPYFDQTGILIVMKKPIPDTSLFKFMSVLRLEVWLSILGALSITAIVIWILEVLSPYSGRNWSYTEACRLV